MRQRLSALLVLAVLMAAPASAQVGNFARVVINGVNVTTGSASPEGAVTGAVGDVYIRTNGSLYTKTSGSGTTGWTLLSGGGGSGTVTSVGLTMPGIFSVSGSPVATSGAIAVSLGTQTAGTVFAGPASGSDAQPAFRAIVFGDWASNSCTSGQIPKYNGSAWACGDDAGASTGAPAAAQYVTLATDATLNNERVLTSTSNQITVTDGGAGAAVTLSTPQDLATSSTPQFARVGFGAAADASAVALFNGLYTNDETVDDGNSGTADTIDWATGNVHHSTLTGNVTYTFSNPKDSAGLVLFLNTGAGSFTVTWPAAVKWFGGSAPTITTTADKVDVVVCRYLTLTTSYYCGVSQNANE
jgi:hypothetical protein